MKILNLNTSRDNGSQIFTDSTFRNTVSANGNPRWSNAYSWNSRTSIYLDGIDDYLSIPDSVDFFFGSNDFTVSFFVKRQRTGILEFICGQGTGTSGQIAFRLAFNTSNIQIFINSTQLYITGFAVNDTLPHHVEISRSGGSLYGFIDGILKGTVGAVNTIDRNENFLIGSQCISCEYLLNAYIWKFQMYNGECLHTSDFIPNPAAELDVEHYSSIRVAAARESWNQIQTAKAAHVEKWNIVKAQKKAFIEKSWGVYVDATTKLEMASRLDVVGTTGREIFASLAVKGSLAAVEYWKSLSVEATIREIHEVYHRLAVLGAVSSNIFQQEVGLIIDESAVDFISFQERPGRYYRQFDVVVNVSPDAVPNKNVRLIRSLPLYAEAIIVLQSTLLLEGGPQTVVDREIVLMYDGVQEEGITTDQQTGAVTHTATLRLVSPTAGLGYLKNNAGAKRFTKSWPAGTMCGDVLDELFANTGLSYDLGIGDDTVGQLDVQDLFPNEIWPKITLGRFPVRTDDDGEKLIIAHALPCLPSALQDQTPDHDLDPAEYLITSTTADDGGQLRYSMIRVANYQDATENIALNAPEEGEPDGSGMKPIYGWPVPWRKVWLRGCHEPHDGYELRAEGVAEELELDEVISFDNGQGRTQRPVHGLISVDWMGNISLGAVTPHEDGALTAATSGKSVALIKYKTKRYKFSYRDSGEHTMSLWLTDEEA